MNELRLKARKLKNEKDFDGAIAIYNQIYSDKCDKWISWEYAYCLKQVGRIDEAIDICKSVYNTSSNFKYNNDMLGWLLYEKYFKHVKEEYSYEEINKLHDIALFVPKIISQEDKSAYDNILLRMIKITKKHANNSDDKILSLLNLLDPNKLSDSPHSYMDERREKEYQSDKEMYYAYKTKALYNIGSYDDCLKCCNEAVNVIESFHHNNDIWIDVRRTLAIAEIEGCSQGIAELKRISVMNPHWTIFSKLAKLYIRMDDTNNALLNYFRAAITPEPSKMKVSLFYDIYKLLNDIGDKDWAKSHAFYIIGIREAEGWSLNNELQQIKDNNKNYDKNTRILEQNLRDFWLKNIHYLLGTQSGTITKIHSNGKFGFVKDQNNSYYFQSKTIVQNKRININDKVKFCVVESFDFKKSKYTKEAAYIILDD